MRTSSTFKAPFFRRHTRKKIIVRSFCPCFAQRRDTGSENNVFDVQSYVYQRLAYEVISGVGYIVVLQFVLYCFKAPPWVKMYRDICTA